MNIKATSLLALMILGVAACSHNSAADLPPGKYQTSTSSKDANGTAVDKDVTTNVSVDQNGNKNVDTSTKTSVDPKGLFNKTTDTTDSHQTYGQ
jgi:hypothetical protein